MTGLGAQMGKFKHGIGTKHPFRFLTFEGVPAQKLKDTLESMNLAGLSFRLKKLQDSQGKEIVGVYIIVSNWSEWKPTQLAFAMMELSAKWENPSPFTQAKDSEITLFNKHLGSTAWWEHLANSGQSVTPAPFMDRWERECKNFQTEISRFFLYK